MRSRFIFQILYRNVELYLTALRSIDRKSEQIESQLHKSTRNEELINSWNLKNDCLFQSVLKTNERVIKITSATSNIKIFEDEDLLEIHSSKLNRQLRWRIFMEISCTV